MTEHMALIGLLVIAGLAGWLWWRGAIRSIIRGETIAAPPASLGAP